MRMYLGLHELILTTGSCDISRCSRYGHCHLRLDFILDVSKLRAWIRWYQSPPGASRARALAHVFGRRGMLDQVKCAQIVRGS